MSSQAGNAPAAAGPSAAQQVMQSEAQERERRVLQALIEAAAVTDPTITQRVTIAAVWQYMRLPDESFGWSGRKDEQGNRPRMPTEAKALCILTTLSLGLMPGVGHVLWLGNKCYVTADARRFLANASTDWVKVGSPRYRPFSPEEKDMFAIADGDMHCVIEQPIRLKGETLTVVGYGLIGLDELEFRDRNQNRKAGMQTKKDAVMHLITRAERDMLNRNFPLKGIGDAPEEWRDDALDVTPTPSPALTAPPATAIMAAEEAAAVSRQRQDATMRVVDLAARVVAAGGKPSELLGVSLAGAWFTSSPVDQMHDAGDALEAWLAEHETQPDPTPPGASSPQPSPTAAEPAAPAKKRGRPRKDATAAAPASESMSEKSTPAAPVVPMAHAGAPQAGDLVAMSPDVVDEAGDPDWEGEEPTLERAQMRDLTDETLAMAEGGEFGADLSEEGDAFEGPSVDRGSPAPSPPAAPAPSGPITAARDRAASAERLRKAMDGVLQRGGAPMSVLGYNPHNRLGDPRASAYELEEMARLLEAWSPDKRSPVEKNNAAREAQGGPAPVQRPAAPSSFDRVPAHDMIERALGMSDNTPEIRAKLEELGRGPLDSSDHLRLPKAIREAKNGNCRGLDELLAAARKAR